MDPLTIASMATQAAAGIGQIITGIGQKSQANKIARSNVRPTYIIPKSVTDNQAITESRASQGLSDQSKSLYTQESDRGATAGIDAILSGGGSVNNIADLYGARNTGISHMALIDDSMRSANMKALVDQNNTMADFKDKEWQVNMWGPYADKAQAAAALSKQGSDNTWKGINTLGAVPANAALNNKYASEAGNVFPHTPAPGYGSPQPYSSSVIPNMPTVAQTVQSKWPGLMMGRGNFLPAGSAEGMTDPITGLPIGGRPY